MASVSAYRAGSLLARHVPVVVQNAVARAVGAASTNTGQKRLVAARNLERVLRRPMSSTETRRRVAKTFEWYTRYYAESFRLPSVPVEEIDRGFGFEGFGEIAAAVERGQGPILALPHLGTWEWAAWWLALVPEFKVTAVVEPLEPPELFEWFRWIPRVVGHEYRAPRTRRRQDQHPSAETGSGVVPVGGSRHSGQRNPG